MKKVFLVLTILLGFLCTGVHAVPYAMNFDPDAGDTGGVEETIYGWDLEAVAEDSLPSGFGPVDLVTHQELGDDGILNDGDEFYESFTLDVLNGLGAPPAYSSAGMQAYYVDYPLGDPVEFDAALYMDVTLEGYITNYDNGAGGDTTASTATLIKDDTYDSIFDDGGAVLYVDVNDNQDYDDTVDTRVGEWDFRNAGVFALDPGVFAGANSEVDFGFTATYLNEGYFSTALGFADPQTLIDSQFLITFAQGGVATAIGGDPEGVTSTDPDEILIAFQETGFDARFEVVPEPATMFLFGVGLLGIVGISRRKQK